MTCSEHKKKPIINPFSTQKQKNRSVSLHCLSVVIWNKLQSIKIKLKSFIFYNPYGCYQVLYQYIHSNRTHTCMHTVLHPSLSNFLTTHQIWICTIYGSNKVKMPLLVQIMNRSHHSYLSIQPCCYICNIHNHLTVGMGVVMLLDIFAYIFWMFIHLPMNLW